MRATSFVANEDDSASPLGIPAKVKQEPTDLAAMVARRVMANKLPPPLQQQGAQPAAGGQRKKQAARQQQEQEQVEEQEERKPVPWQQPHQLLPAPQPAPLADRPTSNRTQAAAAPRPLKVHASSSSSSFAEAAAAAADESMGESDVSAGLQTERSDPGPADSLQHPQQGQGQEDEAAAHPTVSQAAAPAAPPFLRPKLPTLSEMMGTRAAKVPLLPPLPALKIPAAQIRPSIRFSGGSKTPAEAAAALGRQEMPPPRPITANPAVPLTVEVAHRPSGGSSAVAAPKTREQGTGLATDASKSARSRPDPPAVVSPADAGAASLPASSACHSGVTPWTDRLAAHGLDVRHVHLAEPWKGKERQIPGKQNPQREGDPLHRVEPSRADLSFLRLSMLPCE